MAMRRRRLQESSAVVAIPKPMPSPGTGTGATARRLVFGIVDGPEGHQILRDWELLELLNACRPQSNAGRHAAREGQVASLISSLSNRVTELAPMMKIPRAWPAVLLVPGETRA